VDPAGKLGGLKRPSTRIFRARARLRAKLTRADRAAA